MKKLIVLLSLIICLFSTSNSFAQGASAPAKYYVYKYNGGPSGFATIWEGMDADVYSLKCENPGTKTGQMSAGKDVITSKKGSSLSISKDIEPYVVAQMAKNVLGGTYQFPASDWEVTWKGTNVLNYKMRITEK